MKGRTSSPPDTFQESAAKQAVRGMLCDLAAALGRPNLTYMGLPGRRALDIIALARYLRAVICIDKDKNVLDECSTAIARFGFSSTFYHGSIWDYLAKVYPGAQSIADIAFLDFCGGGLTTDSPFAVEIAGLRAYFAKHAAIPNRAFVLAWTYMPRDKGNDIYRTALANLALSESEKELLQRAKGLQLRSIAVRLFLRQCLEEHQMTAKMYQHALYKTSMNTVLVVFAKGADSACAIGLRPPADLLHAAVTKYEEGRGAPVLQRLL